ncbi:hypothetical protein BJ742DRAFT_873216 [Cladochytrium replicatum]|nr:hypothetical protein BJ742DRAFT_873216 [Cladochytrium replicatum]
MSSNLLTNEANEDWIGQMSLLEGERVHRNPQQNVIELEEKNEASNLTFFSYNTTWKNHIDQAHLPRSYRGSSGWVSIPADAQAAAQGKSARRAGENIEQKKIATIIKQFQPKKQNNEGREFSRSEIPINSKHSSFRTRQRGHSQFGRTADHLIAVKAKLDLILFTARISHPPHLVNIKSASERLHVTPCSEHAVRIATTTTVSILQPDFNGVSAEIMTALGSLNCLQRMSTSRILARNIIYRWKALFVVLDNCKKGFEKQSICVV